MADDDFNVFSEAQLPVTKADMTKPNKEFVVKLISVFFEAFHLDGYSIKQATLEQLSVLIFGDPELYEDVLYLINMHVAMSGIFERIFVKDFHLMDIISPSPKKNMKLMKFLANFVLYYKNKLSEIEESVSDLMDRKVIVDESIEKMKDGLEKIASSETYREIQSEYNEKSRTKIEEARQQMKTINNVMEEKKEEIKLLELERQKVIAVCATKQGEAVKISEKTSQLQAQVVESPEELKTRLQEFEKQKDLKINEREVKYHLIKEKKKLLEHREHIQVFIQKEAGILVQVLKILNEKKGTAKKLENIIKDQERIRDEISKLEKNHEIQQNHCSVSEITELNQQIEQRLSPLQEQYSQLSKEKKRLDIQFQEEQEEHRKILSQINSTNEEITITEKEISHFQKQCQEIYKKTISENMEINQIFEDLVKKKTKL